VAAALLAGMLLLLASCEDRHTWRADEATIVGWWVEDVAHGTPRRAEELQLVDGSDLMAHLAQWALGSDLYGTHVYPRVLVARLTRLPQLTSLAASHLVQRATDGALELRLGLSIDEQELAAPVVAQENRDRRELDALVLGLTDAREESSQAYLAAVHQARTQLDSALGILPAPPRAASATATATATSTP
jgi:hypothetical protein